MTYSLRRKTFADSDAGGFPARPHGTNGQEPKTVPNRTFGGSRLQTSAETRLAQPLRRIRNPHTRAPPPSPALQRTPAVARAGFRRLASACSLCCRLRFSCFFLSWSPALTPIPAGSPRFGFRCNCASLATYRRKPLASRFRNHAPHYLKPLGFLQYIISKTILIQPHRHQMSAM